jgi:O-6-methylguanine DNA methyltransferase
LPTVTGDGVFIAHYTPAGLCELSFPGREESAFSEGKVDADISEWHRITSLAVVAILAGDHPEEIPPMDLSGHTEFRRMVWAEMQRIPRGKTASYAELARRIGQPNATRAVGGACGANPVPLIIPCHRVLAAGQRLGGFSGGLDWKRKLLAVEGITYRSERVRRETRDHAGQGAWAELTMGKF